MPDELEDDERFLLELPSGALARLDRPRLRYVLLHGGSEDALVEAAWAGEVDPSRLTGPDRRAVALWTLKRLPEDDDAEGFERACARYGVDVATELHITDPLLRLACRTAFARLGIENESEETAALLAAARGG